MKIPFHKYHGTGNDFVIIDNRHLFFDYNNKGFISKLCSRRFGIGADGLILLQEIKDFDFEMIYFNADGKESSMCANGGRCIMAFAQKLGIINNKAKFLAIDGHHEGIIEEEIIRLKMKDVNDVEMNYEYCFINTGSPHYLVFVNNIDEVDVVKEGRNIRYNDRFRKQGTNVNFLEKRNDLLFVRTYERGVEDETLSCGTGVVAAALYASLKGVLGSGNSCDVSTSGGVVIVRFNKHNDNKFNNIWLDGPAAFVFKGEI
ncbi:MAG: diaminopimelate epimerase [Bacteroidota bacterium]